jgi:hypothetical protein
VANTVEHQARDLLHKLRVADRLASAVDMRARGAEATFAVDFGDGEEEPVFRVRLRGRELHLDVRQGSRWTATPEHGSVDHLISLLMGPLRFVWYLHAGDAIEARGG